MKGGENVLLGFWAYILDRSGKSCGGSRFMAFNSMIGMGVLINHKIIFED